MLTRYVVRRGDTLSKIAQEHGTTWQQIYLLPQNAPFRRKRPNPNQIEAGDVVLVDTPDNNYEVPGMQLIPQADGGSCWYASARMLIAWRSAKAQASLANLVPPELDLECMRLRDVGQGIQNSQIIAMAKRLGLRPIPPMSPTPAAIAGWLKQYGPLWVNGSTHIVVIAGIMGSQVKVYDPGPVGVGRVDWRSLETWYAGGVNPAGQGNSTRDTDRDVQAVFLYVP